MKWKYIAGLFVVTGVGLISMMLYYHLDFSLLTSLSFYEDLANPSMRIVSVPEGLRKEQIADLMATKLGWDDNQKDDFVSNHLALDTKNLEGHYFPKTYLLPMHESPTDVTANMTGTYTKQTATVKKSTSTKIVNADTALKIASIIQREAAGKSDMKLISGIIWNRLFNGMKLQIDATLQYAKGNEEDGWWRRVTSQDKNINSPYNTYQNPGLPPSPISNPGLAAIEAAYNPLKTSCLFYLHDKNHVIHCSKTYAEHEKNVQRYLGGK